MRQNIAAITYLVSDYDEAIQFFVEALGFELVEDTCLEQEQPGKRWVVVRPRGSAGCSLLLAKAVGDAQSSAVGNQSGGRVFLFLHTDDFCAEALLVPCSMPGENQHFHRQHQGLDAQDRGVHDSHGIDHVQEY